MRRKQLLRVVRELAGADKAEAAALLARLGMAPSARPETLTPSDFVALYQSMPRLTAG
jgi:16S rRNA A1518/A1519 N6-dimethyltransferase RsmA/KsgA/DIM1 with predicted DNA glycosylase/AP lyase activity